ncbi:MAG: indole-3-glycerol phosphate synthase TrpC [Spirochaetes bacterium]|nr:indole-3-glycerol phosphate synthase TrpC [Spirochaetota bacterium]
MSDTLRQIADRIAVDEADFFRSFRADAWKPASARKPVEVSARLARGFFLVCELKKASPSKGLIRESFHPVALARAYEEGGAGALSVLTEKNYFLGSKEYLREVRGATSLPLLRKDFIFHPAQVYEAFDLGADLVLLIAALLDDETLGALHRLIRSLGMTPLVEVHDEGELERALPLAPPLLGINNRDLRTLKTDFSTCLRLRKRVPASVAAIAESSIETPEQLRTLQDAGFAGALVGESLMRQDDVAQAVRRLKGLLAP